MLSTGGYQNASPTPDRAMSSNNKSRGPLLLEDPPKDEMEVQVQNPRSVKQRKDMSMVISSEVPMRSDRALAKFVESEGQ